MVLFIAETLGLDPEVARANTVGFVGCLSSVQYNHIAPLKAALRHANIAPVTVQGTLTESNCGSMEDSDMNAVTTVHSSSGTSERLLSWVSITLLLCYRVKQLVNSTQLIYFHYYRWLQIVTGFSQVISVFTIYSDGNKLMEKRFTLLHSTSIQFFITKNQENRSFK